MFHDPVSLWSTTTSGSFSDRPASANPLIDSTQHAVSTSSAANMTAIPASLEIAPVRICFSPLLNGNMASSAARIAVSVDGTAAF
jgi:hypothetical protein